MEIYLEHYGKNNCEELRKISDKILVTKFGWISKSMYDEFYSIAGEVFCKCIADYNETKGAKFETYLIMCLNRKFKTYITYMNRKRRNNGIPTISLESLVDEDGKTTILDLIAEKDIDALSWQTQKYLDSLSKIQYKVAEMIMDGYNFESIKKKLNLSDRRFNTIYNRMKSKQKTDILRI